MTYDAKDKIGVGFYHLDPRWCGHREFERMLSLGITNSIKVECGFGTSTDAIEIAKKYGHQAWLGLEKFNRLGKSTQTLSEYMDSIIKYVNTLKERDLWDTVIGFHWDEPILGMSNEDFLNSSKAVSEEFGKRLFPVFSGYETMGKKGNFSDPDGTTILEGFATKYITDFGFDSYCYDFRNTNTAQKNKLAEVARDTKHPEIDSVENYYRCYFNTLRERMENKNAKVWVFPTAYNVYTWAGYHADEDFCIAHARGLKKLLMEFDNPGGIYYYTFKTWRLSEKAMDFHLAKDNPERWEKFESAARDILNEVKDITVK